MEPSMHDIALFLRDGDVSWLLFPSSVLLLSNSTVEPENTFLYPQGDRSGLRKSEKDKYQHQSQLPVIHLPKLVSTYPTIMTQF